MGILDFLKVTVADKGKSKTPAPARKAAGSVVEFDGKSFPIATINAKGFVTARFDGSLVKGQTARVNVKVDEPGGRFAFATTIGVADTAGGKLTAEWNVLPPEVDDAIRKLAQPRKGAGGR